jgi:hypothetical protein
MASLPAQALPLAQVQVSLQRDSEFVAQKSRKYDSSATPSRKSRRVADKEKKGRVRYGASAPGTSIPLTTRGAYLYGPSFNGAYTPPSGYSLSGYPIYYADEIAAKRAECAALRRQAISSGRHSSWDRYQECVED